MNNRILGMLCLGLSVFQLFDGIRWATFHLTANNPLSLILGILLDIGGLCGLWGLLYLSGTGTNKIFQAITFLPVIGFLADLINNLQQLVSTAAPDSPLSIVGGLLILLGMLVVGILTIAAKRLTGWRRFSPLLVSLAFPVGILLRSITHLTGFISIVMGGAMMVFGYAVMSSTIEEGMPGVITQPDLSRNS
jgi:hypothetical protein